MRKKCHFISMLTSRQWTNSLKKILHNTNMTSFINIPFNNYFQNVNMAYTIRFANSLVEVENNQSSFSLVFLHIYSIGFYLTWQPTWQIRLFPNYFCMSMYFNIDQLVSKNLLPSILQPLPNISNDLLHPA
jgi:hypothetical protein